MQVRVKWAILGVGIGCFTLGVLAQDKVTRKDHERRKPLLITSWTAIVIRAQEEKLNKGEITALVKNVLARVPYKYTLEDVNKIVDEEIEFLTIVR
jgi:hypothetical protein